MIGFALPLAGLALLALAIPLAIHWLRRRPPPTRLFAAQDWLAVPLRQWRQRRVDRPWLLLLRLLLIAGAVALLAAPRHRLPAATPPVVVAFAPGLDPAALAASLEGIAADVPRIPLDGPARAGAAEALATELPLASRIRALDARLPAGTRLLLRVPPTVTGLDAERLRLARPVDWQGVAAAPEAGSEAASGSGTGRASPPSSSVVASGPRLRIWPGSASGADVAVAAAPARLARALAAAAATLPAGAGPAPRAAAEAVVIEPFPAKPVAALAAAIGVPTLAITAEPDAAAMAPAVLRAGLNSLQITAPNVGEIMLRAPDGSPWLRREAVGLGARWQLDPAALAAADPRVARVLLAALPPPAPGGDRAPAAQARPLPLAADDPGPVASASEAWTALDGALALLLALLAAAERVLAARRPAEDSLASEIVPTPGTAERSA